VRPRNRNMWIHRLHRTLRSTIFLVLVVELLLKNLRAGLYVQALKLRMEMNLFSSRVK
jgi:hypothetical protein